MSFPGRCISCSNEAGVRLRQGKTPCFAYARRRLIMANPAKPINPAPNSASEAGSGTEEVIGVMFQAEPVHDNKSLDVAELLVVMKLDPFHISR